MGIGAWLIAGACSDGFCSGCKYGPCEACVRIVCGRKNYHRKSLKTCFSNRKSSSLKLQAKGEWKQESAEGITLYYRDLKFERYSLRFLLSFDADGSMNTIRLMPVPAASTAKPVAYNKEKMQERDITVGADDFKLPGTLTLPVGKKKAPVVILVHGSGPQDRDETVGPNKPFRDLAWGLAERGIATVRYDKRTKVYGAACVPEGRNIDYDTESVDDAVAIIAWAKELPEVDAVFMCWDIV